MGIDRPSRSSEDDEQPRRPERGQPEQKPPERGETKPSRPERPQSQAERTREANKRAAEAYRERHNSMTGTERRQAIRDKQAQYIAEEKEKASRSPEAKHAEAKAYLEQRKARIEAYERGDLPKDQLSRSERNDARKREFDRLVAAQKAKEEREATKAEREQGRARPDTAPAGQTDRPATGDSSPDRPPTRHEREPADGPRRHETREEADARIEARERAEHQNMTLAEAIARADEEEGPDDDFAALGRGDNPYASVADRGDERGDRPKVETADRPQARIESAKSELRAALDSGDDARLVEAARRLVDSADTGETGADGERTGERSPDQPADAISAEPADNDGQTDAPYRKSLELTAAERAAELQGLLPEASRGRITMAVGMGHDADEALRTVIGTSEPNGYLRPSVRAKLQEGEEVAGGTSHAERNITAYMRSNEIKPLTIGAGRPICPPCSDAIDTAGASPATPLKER